MIDKQGVARLLESIREELNLSLDEMAERVGIPKSSLYHYINDAASLPKPEVTAKICEGYGISFEDLARAAGYSVGSLGISVVERRHIIKDTPIDELLMTRYGLDPSQIMNLVTLLETGLSLIERGEKLDSQPCLLRGKKAIRRRSRSKGT